ncbi:MAG: hypothetical protein J6A63_01595, partial [Clostridia bacterium]|nr:hypothetical protein [Clostridia bacterium]
SSVYFKPATSGITFPIDSWDAPFSYVEGNVITVNGTMISMENSVKSPSGDFYVGLGQTVSEGAILKIGGVLRCGQFWTDYVIEDCSFQWNGSEWVAIYDEYTVSDLIVHEHSTAARPDVANASSLWLFGTGDASDKWAEYTCESGTGVQLNGAAASIKVQDFGGGLYLSFAEVNEDDVITIGGTFVNHARLTRYIINTDYHFKWNGSGWVAYVPSVAYTTYTVGKVAIDNGSSASGVYLKREDGNAFAIVDSTWAAKLAFEPNSGAGAKLNDTKLTDIAIPGSIYVNVGAAKKGDVLIFGGTFYNDDLKVKYVVTESKFVWSGSSWVSYYAESELAVYDVVTLVDLGLGIEKAVEGVYDGSQNTYTASAENTTGSVKFRFQVNSVDTENGAVAIRLRGSEWSGVRFEITEGVIRTWNETANSQRIPLSNDTDYVVELGALDVLNSGYIWVYIKIDGVLMASEMLLKTEISDTDGAAYGTYNTNAVSLYVETTNITFTDPDHVSVTYTASCGSNVEYAEKNSNYTVSSVVAKTYNTFIGWVYNDALYTADDTLQLAGENITLTALEIDFRLEEGAAIRVGATADTSGIRFTTLLKETDLNTLKGYIGEGSVSYGTLILPYDYLGAGEGPNLEEFTQGVDIIKISSTYSETNNDGYIVYRGAMQKLYEENYGRLFAGRGYMEITLEGGKTIRVYTPFDKKDNVRSIRQIAQAFQVDTSEPAEGEIRYATLSETRKAIVDAYAALNEIELMDYAAYAANNFFNVIAWNYPELDESNNYNNETNEKIVKDMKATGIRVVNLTGVNLLVLNTQEAIEKTRQIINFFWSKGLQTVAFAANNVENFNVDFTQIGTPDFSDCEGFIGFIHWDEPVPGTADEG